MQTPVAPPPPSDRAAGPPTDRLTVPAPPVAERQAPRRVAPAERLALPGERHWSVDVAEFASLALLAVALAVAIWVAGFLLGFGYLVARALLA